MKVISLVLKDIRNNKREFIEGLLVLSLIIFLASLSISMESGAASRINDFYVKAGGSTLLLEENETLPYFKDIEEKIEYYNALDHNSTADLYHLIQKRGDIREYLGVRVNLLGVPENFQLKSDYYLKPGDIRRSLVEGMPFINRSEINQLSEAQEWLNIKRDQRYIRLPLLPREGAKTVEKGEILLDRSAKEFLDLDIGDTIKLDIKNEGKDFIGVFKLVGTFKTVGTQGTDKTFWRVYHNLSFFDIRPPESKLSSIVPAVVNKKDIERKADRILLKTNSIDSKNEIYRSLKNADYNVYKPRVGGHIKLEESLGNIRKEIGFLSLGFLFIEFIAALSVGFVWSFNRRGEKRIYRNLGFDRFQAGMSVLLALFMMILTSFPLITFIYTLIKPYITSISFKWLFINYLIVSISTTAAGMYASWTKA